jgi:hypothetical protein
MYPGRPAVPRQQQRGKDGWDSPETGLNKAGQYIAFTPAILAAVAAYWVFSIPVVMLVIAAIVAVFGIVGGILNVYGRGPVWCGAIVGIVTSVGGFFTVAWWLHFRKGEGWWIEVIIAFVIGCLPGILVQYLLQKVVRRNAG